LQLLAQWFASPRWPPNAFVTGKELLATPEHALHVLEVITAARE